MLVLALIPFFCFLFLFCLLCLFLFFFCNCFRFFVLSFQIEFAVLLNGSLVISNTTHKLYVIRFMCRLYVIRSMHILYVIRFIYILYVIRSMYRMCGIRFVQKLSVSWSVYKLYVIWCIGLLVIYVFACVMKAIQEHIFNDCKYAFMINIAVIFVVFRFDFSFVCLSSSCV